MNKLLRERAARWATALLKRKPNAPGTRWTYGTANAQLQAAWLAGANAQLQAAWLAGAKSMDEWHRQRLAKAVGVDGRVHAGFSIVSTDDGQGEVLTIPALGSRPKHCVFRADMCIHGYKLVDLADGTSVCDAGCTA